MESCQDRRRTAAGTAVLLLGCAVPLLALQATAPKGSLEGRVVNAVSGEALRKVNLTLTRMHAKDRDKPAATQTDEYGHFAFRDVEAGAYRLSGQRTGFLRQEYGARLNPNSGAVLVVPAGQVLKDVTFKLAPDAVISGRVTDQDGEPMPNLVVAALRSGYVRGKRQWTQAGGAQTNDRGEFRIGGLRPGRYLVSATDLNIGIGLAGMSTGPLPEKPEMSYGPTYFGNTPELERAAPVDVQMGDDRRGVEIQMLKTPTVRVRGRVVGLEGRILVMILVRKGAPGVGISAGALGIVQPTDGTFEVKGVTPGMYVLTALSATEAAGPLAGAMRIEVADQHVDGIEFRLGGGGDLGGGVTLPDGKPGSAKNTSVALEMVDFDLPNTPSALAGDDGTFTLKSVFPGTYRVNVSDMPEDCYVQSVKLGGQEVGDEGVEWSAGASAKLAIVLSRAGAQVEGVALRGDNQPLAGALVALIPDSGRASRYRSTTTDHDGTFTLKGVPPGKYQAIAWEDLEPGAFRDAEFVKAFEGSAERLSLEENGHSKITLKAVAFEKAAGGKH